jgi:hypothetical protein
LSAFPIYHMRVTCPTHLIFLNMITLTMFGEVHKLWSSSGLPPLPPSEVQSRGVAMKFPVWFHCKPHTCTLTADWEGSPSKYSPSVAMHLAQRCCNNFGTPVVEELSVPSSHFYIFSIS